ncbi:MAG TPA: PrsW family intramembrane metalloprotease [Candidatus Dormibacteraeota bacterium]|nr:PrsW family intramembrane metalloprotease [Candidatus Dormibacteraeota bacterium]
MIRSTVPPAADPESRLRPLRYGVAIAVAALVVVALVASSILNYVYLDTIPARASLYGLLAVASITLGTYILVRAFDRDRATRRNHLIRAAVLIGLGVLLWLLVIDVFVFTQSAGPVVAAVCALACVPTTAFGLFIVRRMDRNHKEPWRLVLVAAAWGAIVATSLVVWGETLWESSAQHALVPGPGLDTSLAFMAGLLEELAKGLAVLLLFLVMRNQFDDVVDGIVYGAAVGLGFNFLESVSYMTNLYSIYAPEGTGAFGAGTQWYGRQVLGLFLGHATYTAYIGAGVGIARQLPLVRQKVLAIVAGFVVAIAAHFAWDAWATFFPIQNDFFGIVEVHLRTLIMNGPFVAGIVALLLFGIRYEGQNLLDQLRKEAATGRGAILPEEVAILASPWHRLRQRFQAMGRAGVRGYFKVSRLQTAQLDLAMERWHRERKEIDTPLEAEQQLRDRVIELRHWVAA